MCQEVNALVLQGCVCEVCWRQTSVLCMRVVQTDRYSKPGKGLSHGDPHFDTLTHSHFLPIPMCTHT